MWTQRTPPSHSREPAREARRENYSAVAEIIALQPTSPLSLWWQDTDGIRTCIHACNAQWLNGARGRPKPLKSSEIFANFRTMASPEVDVNTIAKKNSLARWNNKHIKKSKLYIDNYFSTLPGGRHRW
jgi:hypothetical protein